MLIYSAGYSKGASGGDIHTINGGPGQLAGSAIAGAGLACKPNIRGCPGGFVPTATPAFLHARNGIDADVPFQAMKALF